MRTKLQVAADILTRSNAYLMGAIKLTNDYHHNYPILDRERTFRLVNEFLIKARRGYRNYAVNIQRMEINR